MLPPQQVDMLIQAGGDALKASGVFRDFLASLGGPAAHLPRRGRPIAGPVASPQQASSQ